MSELDFLIEEGLDARIKRLIKEDKEEQSFEDADEEYTEEPETSEEEIDDLPSGSEVSEEEMKKLQGGLTPEQQAKGGKTTKKKHEELNARDKEDELEDDDLEDSDDSDESEYEEK